MNGPLTAALCVVAALATVFAITAGSNVAVAVPADAVAIGAGALLLLGMIEQTRWPRIRWVEMVPADPMRVRPMFGAGTLGRPSLVRLLDSLQRTGGRPDASPTSPEEIARLQGLSREQFRAYLDARVSELERRT